MNNVFIYILTTYPAPNILHVSIHAIQCVALLCLCTHLQILCLELPRDLSSNNTNVPVLKWTSKIFPHHDKQRTISYLHIEISKILKVSWYLQKKGIETNKRVLSQLLFWWYFTLLNNNNCFGEFTSVFQQMNELYEHEQYFINHLTISAINCLQIIFLFSYNFL